MASISKFSRDSIEVALSSVAFGMGYSSVKEKQKEVVVNFVSGKDVFATLPTGYGKSLCFACLPGVFDKLLSISSSTVVVITPLTSIMKDQVK